MDAIYWYVIVSITVVLALVLGLYWIFFRKSAATTPTGNNGSLPEPVFNVLSTVALPNVQYVSSMCYDPATNFGFMSTVHLDKTEHGLLFRYDPTSAAFSIVDNIDIPNVGQGAILGSLCVVFTPSKCIVYSYKNSNWTLSTAPTFQAVPQKLWKGTNTTYCVGYWGKSVVVAAYQSQENWNVVYTSNPSSVNILAVDIADDNGTIYFIDSDFRLLSIKMNPNNSDTWDGNDPTDLGQIWSNLGSTNTVIANIASNSEGSFISVALARKNNTSDNAMQITFDVDAKKIGFQSEIDKSAMVASVSCLPDFRMLSFVESDNLTVYRTSVENDFSVTTGDSSSEQKGDPAQFNNLNSVIAELFYYDSDGKILLIAGGASETETLTFYSMNITTQ